MNTMELVEILYRTCSIVVDVIVLFLNPIIISVICNDRQLRRQPSIIYIANLALVDLFLAGVNFINSLLHYLHVSQVYLVCVLFHIYLPFCLITASLLFMFTNSVDRFIFIRMSLKYHSLMNSRTAKRVALVIWTYSLAYPILPFIMFDHIWKYSTCADFILSDSFRYGHIPVQTIFFLTIVFTALMFISVFRVVKNSRRLRHVPTRSSSMESLSTAVSTPTLNISAPTLPPISELIPYEHEHVENSSSSETDTPEIAPNCTQNVSTDHCVFPAVMANNLHLSSEDFPPDLTKAQILLDIIKQENTEGAHMITNDIKATRDREEELGAPHLQMQNPNIVSSLTLHSLTAVSAMEPSLPAVMNLEAGKHTDISHSRKHTEISHSRRHTEISHSRRHTEISHSVYMQKNTTWTFPTMHPEITVPLKEACKDLNQTALQDKSILGSDVHKAANRLTQETSIVVSTSEEYYLNNAAKSPRRIIKTKVMLNKNNELNAYSLKDTINEKIKTPRKKCIKEHLGKMNKKHRRKRSFPIFEMSDFSKESDIQTKRSRKRCRCRCKAVTTIPTEPLEMLNFKLQNWNTNDITQSADISHRETDLSHRETDLSHRETDFIKPNVFVSTPFGGNPKSSNTHNEDGYQNHAMHLNVPHFGPLSSVRMRRRNISTSDNSSVISNESISSFSHGTTESTMTFESGVASSVKMSNLYTDSSESDLTDRDVKSAVAQKKLSNSFSQQGSCHNPSTMFTPGHDASPRARRSSVRAHHRASSGRPQRPNRLSFRNQTNEYVNSNSPRLSFKLPARTYVRNISTSTVSSTSSIPFGIASYSGRDIRTFKILFLMFCVYIMLWLPSFIIQVLRYFPFEINIEVSLIGYTVLVANSVVNFFVYPMRIPKLRVSFKKLFSVASRDFKKNVHWLMSMTKRRLF